MKYAVRHICLVTGLLCGALLLTHNADTGISSTAGFSSSIAQAAQAVVHNCPRTMPPIAYWNSLLKTQPEASHIEHIACQKLQGNASQQALITVRHNGNAALLDAYVYTAITGRHPELLFSVKGLLMGDATISGYNTVLASEADRHSIINEGRADDQLTQDLYREFRWSNTAGRFMQVAFPGMFPDITRYQAEIDQQRVAYGLDQWKRNAAEVAAAAAKQFFAWKRAIITATTDGGGTDDLTATVRVTQVPAVKSTIPAAVVIMRLDRLEGKLTNIWEVTAISSNGSLTLTSPGSRSKITSPVHITGQGPSDEGIAGMAFMLDHQSLEIGHAIARATGKNNQFQADVAYTPTTAGSVHEEGIIALFSISAADGSIFTAVMEKVVL